MQLITLLDRSAKIYAKLVKKGELKKEAFAKLQLLGAVGYNWLVLMFLPQQSAIDRASIKR